MSKNLPKLMMVPEDGEYHIYELPVKKSWLQDLLDALLVGGFLFGIISFVSYVVYTVNTR